MRGGRAAVGLVLPTEPELRLLQRWLDCWRGVGDVVTGMKRQGYWLHLSNVDAGTWRATFSRDAMISADGFGADATPQSDAGASALTIRSSPQ
jgi:hypothetical protein